MKILKERESAVARDESEFFDLPDFKELVRKEVPDNLDEKERQEAIEGIRRGIEDMKAGRVKPAEQVFRELEEKFGISHDD